MKALVKKLGKQTELIEIEDNLQPKENEVLIKVASVGLCRTDLFVSKEIIKVEQDLILGHEFSGKVIEGREDLVGKNVTVNPLYPNRKFMGLDFNGALVEKIIVPISQVIVADKVSSKVAAYLEPVAASMAILNAKLNPSERGAIYGKNRIAELSYIIAHSMGVNLKWLDEKKRNSYESDTYDYIIETIFAEEDLKEMFRMLKEGGRLIVKSRKKQPVSIEASQLVSKNLTMQAVNYYDFNKAMKWLAESHELIDHLLGESFHINDWEKAFDLANSGESNKIFIHFN